MTFFDENPTDNNSFLTNSWGITTNVCHHYCYSIPALSVPKHEQYLKLALWCVYSMCNVM